MTAPQPAPTATAAAWFDLPLQLADGVLKLLEDKLPPPAWAVHEAQQKTVLLLNHVLQDEPEAMARIKRQSGKTLHFFWRSFELRLVATPVGLLDLDEANTAVPDLRLTLTQTALPELAQALQSGQTPAMRIEGDVQLAAEVGWLTQHVRWDLEGDLARIVGNVPAHALANAAKSMADALRRFAQPAAKAS